MRHLFSGNVAMTQDEFACFEVEKSLWMKSIFGGVFKKLAFYHFSLFHVLRAVAAQSAEPIVLISESGGSVSIDSGRNRIGDTNGLVIVGVRDQHRTVDTPLVDDTAEEAVFSS